MEADKDSICKCTHRLSDHANGGVCRRSPSGVPCRCTEFELDSETPEPVALAPNG